MAYAGLARSALLSFLLASPVAACSSTGGSTPPASTDSGGADTGGSPGEDASAEAGAEPGMVADAALPPIDPATPLNSLTSSQKAEVCDWMTDKLGGYGYMMDCGGGTSVSNAPDQATCVATRLTYRCTVTVADLERCIVAEAPSHGCNLPEPACTAVLCGA